MEKALLVTIKIKTEKGGWNIEDDALELEELTSTCGVEVIDNISCVCDKPTPNFLIGRGKIEEIAVLCQENNADAVIFSHDLSGTQQRNIEEVIAKKTIDRTQLILDIFARHAISPAGKAQVELAQLQYLMPRLVGKGIMLSGLGGGIGTRGPGEQKLEVDRRRIRKKIDTLKNYLKNIRLHRLTMRKRRQIRNMQSVALVGYTNAGKSTLLNALTAAGQIVSRNMFTTLDPLSKNLRLPTGENIIISDTVGFLHNLPHHLIEAFKATLEEVSEADLLIHVLDIGHPRVNEHHQAVLNVLQELGVGDKAMITALNKIDLLAERDWLRGYQENFLNPVIISAQSRENLGLLVSKIGEKIPRSMVNLQILIPNTQMRLVDLFYREGKVEEVKYLQKNIKIKVNLPRILYLKLLQNKEIEIIN
jgi:GTP-binding protein HflX